jgi:cyclic pyranopterin phosphate synthase
MVDVGGKPVTRREAVAVGEIQIRPKVLRLIAGDRVPKGNVLAAARIAAILAAKRVDEIIPLCHSLTLYAVDIAFAFGADHLRVRVAVRSNGRTGVEMEALTAVSVALLTIYDMAKAADRGMIIGPVYLAKKSGGRSGRYVRRAEDIPWP